MTQNPTSSATSSLNNTNNVQVSSNNKSIALTIIGIIVAVGGLFLLLAYCKVLPHGVNAISKMDGIGAALGGIFLALGIICVRYGLCRKKKTIEASNNNDSIAPTASVSIPNESTKESKAVVPPKLIDAASASNETFYYYNYDRAHDKDWSCGWRCIQTSASSLNLKPSMDELLKEYGEDEGKNKWAEPGIAKKYFTAQNYQSDLIFYKRKEGTKKTNYDERAQDPIMDFNALREKMLTHFKTHETPIFAGDESYAFTIHGINKLDNGETQMIIGDPHQKACNRGIYLITLDQNGAPTKPEENNISRGRLFFSKMKSKGGMLLFPLKTKLKETSSSSSSSSSSSQSTSSASSASTKSE